MFLIEEYVHILLMLRPVHVYNNLLLILCDWGCVREFSDKWHLKPGYISGSLLQSVAILLWSQYYVPATSLIGDKWNICKRICSMFCHGVQYSSWKYDANISKVHSLSIKWSLYHFCHTYIIIISQAFFPFDVFTLKNKCRYFPAFRYMLLLY